MKVYPIALNLALQWEIYILILDALDIEYTDTQQNKIDQKRIIIALIKDYFESTLKIDELFINIFLFKLNKKDIFFIPIVPNNTVSKSNIQNLNYYKKALNEKKFKIPYISKLSVDSEKARKLLRTIIEKPKEYEYLKMSESDTESENSFRSLDNSIEIDNSQQPIFEFNNEAKSQTENAPISETNLKDALEAANFKAFTQSLTSPTLRPPNNQNPNDLTSNPVFNTSQKPNQIFSNNINKETGKVKIQDYVSEENSGSSDEWLDSQLFVITLKKSQWDDTQIIGALLTAVTGDLGKQLSLELQRLNSNELTIPKFREILSKLTKKSSSEYSRVLDKMKYSGEIPVREFYNKIYNIVKKLLVASSPNSRVDEKTCENLSSTYLKSKILRNNYHFQLSEKCGFDLVELAEQIQSINMTPAVSNLNKITTDKRNTGAKPEQNNWTLKNGPQYMFDNKNNIRPNFNYNRNMTARPQYDKPRNFQQNTNFRFYQNNQKFQSNQNNQQFQPRAFHNSQTFRAIECHYCGKAGHGWTRCFIREHEQPNWNPNVGRVEGENDPYFKIDI